MASKSPTNLSEYHDLKSESVDFETQVRHSPISIVLVQNDEDDGNVVILSDKQLNALMKERKQFKAQQKLSIVQEN